MAGKVKFDQEAAFKQIIGADREPGEEVTEQPAKKNKSKDRVQRSYFLDQDIDKALKRMALDMEMNLTETINSVLRKGLGGYISDEK